MNDKGSISLTLNQIQIIQTAAKVYYLNFQSEAARQTFLLTVKLTIANTEKEKLFLAWIDRIGLQTFTKNNDLGFWQQELMNIDLEPKVNLLLIYGGAALLIISFLLTRK